MEENLIEWYNKLNEDEGIAKITVPVMDTGDGKPHGFPPVIEPETAEVPPVIEPEKKVDPVVSKDKQNALMSFVMVRRIQDLLVQVAGLSEPYETDSEERQEMVDSVKSLYIKLGDTIGKL